MAEVELWYVFFFLLIGVDSISIEDGELTSRFLTGRAFIMIASSVTALYGLLEDGAVLRI